MITSSLRRDARAATLGARALLVAWIAFSVPASFALLHPAPIAAPPGATPPAAVPSPDDARPVAAVLLSQAGTEVTDFLAPYAILAASGAFRVEAVARDLEPAPMNGGVAVIPERTLADFDAAHPDGAAVVVIPNVLDPHDAALQGWLRAQSARGALLVSICEGARLLAATGLLDSASEARGRPEGAREAGPRAALPRGARSRVTPRSSDGREATSHFAALGDLRDAHPAVRWRDDRRWVEDGAFVTSAGVTAAIDATLHVVARRAGTDVAQRIADDIGVAYRTDPADPPASLSASDVATAVLNGVLVWPKQRVLVPLEDGVDEIALAAVLDAYPRTFAASSASTSPGRRTIRSRHGLVLVPAEASDATEIGAGVPLVIAAHDVAGAPYARVLDDIARRFGDRSAHLVARQLQAPDAIVPARGTTPLPVARYVAMLLALLAPGAGLGVGGRRLRGRRRQRSRSAPLATARAR